MISPRPVLAAVALLFAIHPLTAQDGSSGLASWDTGQPSAEPLSSEKIAAKTGWTAIPRDQTAASFKGDAVVSNGRVLAVARKLSPAIDVYGLTAGKAVPRARLALLAPGGEAAARLDRAALVENGKGGVVLEAFFKSSKGTALSARFRLTRGDVGLGT